MNPRLVCIDEDGIPTPATAGRPPVSLWGVAPLAPIHLGFDELIVKQRDLIRAGLSHRVLLADLHAVMTHGLRPDDVHERARYYESYLREAVGLQTQYVLGSDFQTRTEYVEALFALLCSIPEARLKNHMPARARQEVAAGARNPAAAYIYVVMQCLDTIYLDADLVFAEAGQRKIYELLNDRGLDALDQPQLSRHRFRQLQYRPGHQVFALYVPTGTDISGRSLDTSRAATRISIHETSDSLRVKIGKMYAPPQGQPLAEGRRDALLHAFEFSVFPWRDQPVAVRARGRCVGVESWSEFRKLWEAGDLHPGDCKAALHECLWARLRDIRERLGRGAVRWVDVPAAIGLKGHAQA